MKWKSVKNYPVTVRFSLKEKMQLKELAKEQNQTVSEFIRMAALETATTPKKTIPKVNRQLYSDLGKITEQLQLTASEENSESLSDLQELLDEVRRGLLGLPSSSGQRD